MAHEAHVAGEEATGEQQERGRSCGLGLEEGLGARGRCDPTGILTGSLGQLCGGGGDVG